MHWSTLLVALLTALLLIAPPFPAVPSDADVTNTADAKTDDARNSDAGAPKASPVKPDPHAKPAKIVSPGKASDRVNVNTADVKQLMTLDGVGHRVAERIVEYRKTNGPFKKPADLRRVEGVGAGLLERNRERIAVK